MTCTIEPSTSMLQVPSIVITPALPSRDSLPAGMRTALDSILGHESTPARYVVCREELDAISGPIDGDGDEHPHIPSNTPSVSADTHYRLELNLEPTHFSLGDALSALFTRLRGTSIPDAPTEDTLVVDSDRPLSAAPINPCPSSDDVVSDVGTGSVPRLAPAGRKCPPTWRHAWYISSLVWPAHRERGSRMAQRDKSLPSAKSKLRQCGADLLARTLHGKRQS